MRGKLITLEGTEGAGKSTQVHRLCRRLEREGHRVVEFREPGGTPLSEEVRRLLKAHPAGVGMTPEAELLLMNAARAQLVRERIRPALEEGRWVVCDRYLDSTVAYQGWGRQMDLEWVRRILEFAVGDTRPDLTVVLTISPQTSRTRVALRKLEWAQETGRAPVADRFEAADNSFFERVEQGFLSVAREEPERVKLVDASGSVEAVEGLVWDEVQRWMVRCFQGVGGGLGSGSPTEHI